MSEKLTYLIKLYMFMNDCEVFLLFREKNLLAKNIQKLKHFANYVRRETDIDEVIELL